MMFLYIGYEIGLLKHIYTSDKKLSFDNIKCYECHTMSEVIYHLTRNENTRGDVAWRIDDKSTFILKEWKVAISHKVLVNYWGGETQIWIENEKGELKLL